MAINIFQGNASKKSAPNKASNSLRAQRTRTALAKPSEVSDSGNTAVATGGTLQKVGNVIGKVAGIAGKFLPGLGGTLAKGIANLFNDPEWWQSVPGDAVTLNAPLRPVQTEFDNYDGGDPQYGFLWRITLGEFYTRESGAANPYVIEPTDTMVTQYLMPQIRKVVNATPLQTASDYSTVLKVNASIYALWRQLLKFDYMLKHGQTYIASMDDVQFPPLRVANAAWLQSKIGRLEEYLRANVRLPHTLCEYLAWRFGRVYRTNNSAKAGLIIYDYLQISNDVANYDTVINSLLAANSATAALQQANADLYNAYYDHDQAVVIADSTQFTYDTKEFCLRTNLDLGITGVTGFGNNAPNPVYVDSAADNPTVFMASTVSTLHEDEHGDQVCLFPVANLTAFIPKPYPAMTAVQRLAVGFGLGTSPSTNAQEGSWKTSSNASIWMSANPVRQAIDIKNTHLSNAASALSALAGTLLIYKSLDVYNKGVWSNIATTAAPAWDTFVDFSAISMDLGLVQDSTINTEQVYAFANLVDVDRKHSMSYNQAEKLVARDTANLIDKLDVAALPTK